MTRAILPKRFPARPSRPGGGRRPVFVVRFMRISRTPAGHEAGWFWRSAGSQAPFLIGAGLSLLAMLCIAWGRRGLAGR